MELIPGYGQNCLIYRVSPHYPPVSYVGNDTVQTHCHYCVVGMSINVLDLGKGTGL